MNIDTTTPDARQFTLPVVREVAPEPPESPTPPDEASRAAVNAHVTRRQLGAASLLRETGRD